MTENKDRAVMITKGGTRGGGIYIGRGSLFGNEYPTKKSKYSSKIYPLKESLELYEQDIIDGKIPLDTLQAIFDTFDFITLDCFCIERCVYSENVKFLDPVCHGEIIAKYLLQ